MTSDQARPRALVAGGLSLATVLVFAPAFSAGWLNWDDATNFVDNPHWRGFGGEQLAWMWSTGWMGHYQPLSWMTMAANHAVGGMDPTGYHVVNVLLHALSVALYFCLLARLFPAIGVGASLVGAAWFGFSPLRVESVAWLTERRDVLGMALLLGALLAWTSHIGRAAADSVAPNRKVWSNAYWLALGLYCLSLLSTAHVLTIPLVLLMLDVWPFKRLSSSSGALGGAGLREVLLEKVPFFAAAAACALATVLAQVDSGAITDLGAVPLERRLEASLYSVGIYPGKMLFPIGLTPFYPFAMLDQPGAWTNAVVVAVLTVVAIATARRVPAVAIAWVTYCVLVLPVSGIMQNGPQLLADRYTYFSGLPLAALMAGGASILFRRSLGYAVIYIIYGASFVFSANLYTRSWQSSVSLWGHAVASGEPDPWALAGLALALDAEGRIAEALPYYQRAWTHPRQNLTRYRITMAYPIALLRTGHEQAALDRLAELYDNPRFSAEARAFAAQIWVQQGRYDEAVPVLEQALRQNPADEDSRGALTFARRRLGLPDAPR